MDVKTLIAVDAYRRLERAEKKLEKLRDDLNKALRSGVDMVQYFQETQQL